MTNFSGVVRLVLGRERNMECCVVSNCVEEKSILTDSKVNESRDYVEESWDDSLSCPSPMSSDEPPMSSSRSDLLSSCTPTEPELERALTVIRRLLEEGRTLATRLHQLQSCHSTEFGTGVIADFPEFCYLLDEISELDLDRVVPRREKILSNQGAKHRRFFPT